MVLLLPALLSMGLMTSGGDPAPGDAQWMSLDRELERLAASQEGTTSGLRTGALLRTNYAWIEDELGSGEDYSGFILDNVRAWIAGEVGALGYFFQLEAFAGDASVLDAYATWQVHERARLTLGQFQPVFLWSSLVTPERLFFILRTDDGQLWHARTLGAGLDGRLDRLAWAVSLENGVDGQGDEHAYTGRLSLDVLGPGVGRTQGSYGAGRHSGMTLGAGYHTDDGLTGDRDVFAVDGQFTRGPLAVWAEWLEYRRFRDPAFTDRSPWSASATWMLKPETYEVGVRYQRTDDADHREAWTFGVNRYVHGHDAKWQLNYVDIRGDCISDRSAVALGLTVNL